MRKIIIKKFNVTNKEITFNPGENYIIGSNGSGKTAFVNTIQYLFGIKRKFSYLLNGGVDVSLECKLGDKYTRISRKKDMLIFEGDLSEKVRVNSKELAEIYFRLLKPDYIQENNYYWNDIINDKIIFSILKGAFVSGENANYLSQKKNRIFKRILGFNKLEHSDMKKDIKNFQNKIREQKEEINNIEDYINEVKNLIDNSEELNPKNKEVFINLLKEPLERKNSQIKENEKLLEQAKKKLNKKNNERNEQLKEKIKPLEEYFKEIISYLKSDQILSSVEKPIKMMDVIEGKISCSSLGQNMLLRLSVLLALYSHNKHNNYYGCGLLVNDSVTSLFGDLATKKIRNIISEITNNNSLQYIEFIFPMGSVPKNKVILNLDKEQVVIR